MTLWNRLQQRGVLLLILVTVLALVGCTSSVEPSKTELAQIEAQKEIEKQEMEEKKLLSDFQNKAYKIYTLEQMTALPELLEKEIPKLSQENAVKMLLNFELSQRMALQNDSGYGAVSSGLAALISQDKGIVDLSQIQTTDQEILSEIEKINMSYFSVYKDENGTYRTVDYNKLKVYKIYLSDECSRYIDYMASESSNPSIKNKIIAVDQVELWKRLVYLDNFFTDYPVPSDDLIRNNLGRYYEEILKHALYGDEKSPNFDKMTGLVTPAASANFTAQKLNPSSNLYLPFENFKTQLTLDQGILTPAVSIQIQLLLRLVNEVVTDHID